MACTVPASRVSFHAMSTTYYVMPPQEHDRLVAAVFRRRGFTEDESTAAARACHAAALHGIRTHNAIKAIHLDQHLGSGAGGCQPGATLEKLPTRFKAVQKWNAHRKLGMAVAYEAVEACMRMADEFGTGTVVVDNAFHYLWGGGYVIDAADRGYIAYTNCTSGMAEVVPHQGKHPTLGTNPHSWGFPTRQAIGFPICVDWATSTVAMGRVQQYAREGRALPPGCGIDRQGRETCDPKEIAALLPFGGHKGYGLALIDELFAGYIGGSLPTLRGRGTGACCGEKNAPCFFFQCMRPDALDCGDFAHGLTQAENVAAVVQDIRAHGNEGVLLPGQIEAEAAALSRQFGGLLFTDAEIVAFGQIAEETGIEFQPHYKTVATAR